MSPIQVRQEPFVEFCLLARRLNGQKGRKEKQTQKPKTEDGKEKVFLPVTDYKPIKKEVAKNG